MKLFSKALGISVLVAAGALAAAGQTAAPAAPAPAAQGSTLAVVNVVDLFNNLKEKTDGDAVIENLKDGYDKEGLKRKDEITRLQNELDKPTVFKPGTPEYAKEQDDLLQKTYDLDSYSNFVNAKLQLELRLRTASLYHKINDAVADYAKANHIVMVFVADSADIEKAPSMDDLKQFVRTRKLMYYDPRFDITQQIIIKMNTEYALGQQGKKTP